MSNELLFYICGGVLAASALVVSFVGLKLKDFPGRALPVIILWFAIFVGGATTFAVLHAQDEEAAEATELEKAGKEIENAETGAASATKPAPRAAKARRAKKKSKPNTATPTRKNRSGRPKAPAKAAPNKVKARARRLPEPRPRLISPPTPARWPSTRPNSKPRPAR